MASEIIKVGDKGRVLITEEILKICRETRRDLFKGSVEPWLKEALKGRRQSS